MTWNVKHIENSLGVFEGHLVSKNIPITKKEREFMCKVKPQDWSFTKGVPKFWQSPNLWVLPHVKLMRCI